MNQFKSFFKELFTEADNFQARSKETGKLVNFKSKASMDAALKAGSHENPTASKGGKASGKAKSGVNIFDKPKAQVLPSGCIYLDASDELVRIAFIFSSDKYINNKAFENALLFTCIGLIAARARSRNIYSFIVFI